MADEAVPAADLDRPSVYEFRLAGHLGPELARWFEGLTVLSETDGTTLLTVLIADQAALHGVLRRIRDVGLPLISIAQVRLGEAHPPRSSKETE